MKLLLVIDVGNTNTVLGLYEIGHTGDDALRAHWRVETNGNRTSDEYAIVLRQLMELEGLEMSEIESAIASSVVPPTLFGLRKFCQRHLGRCDSEGRVSWWSHRARSRSEFASALRARIKAPQSADRSTQECRWAQHRGQHAKRTLLWVLRHGRLHGYADPRRGRLSLSVHCHRWSGGAHHQAKQLHRLVRPNANVARSEDPL